MKKNHVEENFDEDEEIRRFWRFIEQIVRNRLLGNSQKLKEPHHFNMMIYNYLNLSLKPTFLPYLLLKRYFNSSKILLKL